MTRDRREPVLIERTAKKWKALRVLGVALICLGVVSCLATSKTGGSMFVMLVGFGIMLLGEFGAWWNHG